MQKKTEYPPLSPREYISFLRSKFGDPYVNRRFGVKCDKDASRTLQRWTSDEKYVGEEGIRKNPIEKVEDTLTDCMDRGHSMEARAMVGRLARLVGCDLNCLDEVVPDKGDWRDEAMDDLPAFAAYQEAARAYMRGEIAVDMLKQTELWLRKEIQETTAKVIIEAAAQRGAR